MLIGEKSEVYYSTGSHQEDERINYEKERDMENLIEMEVYNELLFDMENFTMNDEEEYLEDSYIGFR